MKSQKRYMRKDGTLMTGEPRYGSTLDPKVLLWGEDQVHNRINVTITDWHTMLSEGWRVKADVSKKEVKRAIKMLEEIYSRMK